jgi:esterase/lipase
MKNLILLHGALGSRNQFELIVEQLKNKEIAVHTLNFSGHGGAAEKADFSMPFLLQIFWNL